MNILHIAPINFSGHSGLSTVIPDIIEHQNKVGDVTAGLLLSRPVDETILREARKIYQFEIFEHSKIDKFNDFILNKHLGYDLVVFHSTYIPNHLKFSYVLNKNNIPYIIVPHGGTSNRIKGIKKFKRALGDMLILKYIVKNAQAIQFLSKGELIDSKFSKKKNFIISNAVNVGSIKPRQDNSSELTFTSISRLDWVSKGLDRQLEAVNQIKQIFIEHNAKMKLFGPSENNSSEKIESFIVDNNLQDIVSLDGPVYGDEKDSILENTDIFVLLSRSEGQPMGVLEALAKGIPCVLSNETNLSKEAEHYNFGWESGEEINEIANLMQNIILNSYDYSEMSKNSIEYIENNHSWQSVTKNALKVYRNIIDNYRN